MATPALRFGDLVHRALAPYYKPGIKRGPDPAETFVQLYHEQAKEHEDKGFNVYVDETWEDALELGIAMLNGYVETYQDADQEWKVLSSEQVFQVPLRLPDGRRFNYVGTLDGVWENRSNGIIIFKEYKTATAINTVGLAMDEQAGRYWCYGPRWLAKQGILPEGATIDHILYTFLRKARRNPDKTYDELGRVLNKDGSISKTQPAPYFHREPVYRDTEDRRMLHERVLAEVRDIMECEEDPSRVYKNPGPLYMPNCAGCAFKDPCELHETGSDFKTYLRTEYVEWSPYAAHELAERH
jgi:hypothetical protein